MLDNGPVQALDKITRPLTDKVIITYLDKVTCPNLLLSPINICTTVVTFIDSVAIAVPLIQFSKKSCL